MNQRTRHGVLLTASLAIVCTSTRAAAEAPDAKARLSQGSRLLAEHKDEEALALFKRAYDIAPGPRAEAQMGIAEGALGRWLDADAHLGAALARKDDPWIKKNAAALEQALDKVGEHVGDLDVQANVAGATLQIDDKPLGALPLSKPVRWVAGTATLTVTATGYVTVRRPIQIVAGTRNREVVELVKVAVPDAVRPIVVAPTLPATSQAAANGPETAVSAAITPSTSEQSAPRSRKGVWIAVGVIAGVVVAGGVTAGILLGVPKNAADPMADLGTQPVRF